MITKPMLAGKVEELPIRYPVICSPKLDGIRCLVLNGQAMSRKLKLIPNEHVRKSLAGLPDGLDGEILSGATFQACSSAVMSHDGTPDFAFHVFDWAPGDLAEPYDRRILELETWSARTVHPCLRVVPTVRIEDEATLLAYEAKCLAEGFEGVMIRDPKGPYKCGRSTEREGYLLKLKRFTTDEAYVIGFTELQHNTNVAEKDALGYTKRSHAKEGLQGAGTLGNFLVRDVKTGIEFEIGCGRGLTQILRQEIWTQRETFLGRIVVYKHQPTGVKERPRFPVFIGFRHPDDM